MNEILEEYSKLRQKYSLPEYELLKKEFYPIDVDDKRFILNEIIERIKETIENITKILENILQPDTNLSNLYEYRYISEEKKDNIYKTYKKLMKFHRYSIEVNLVNNDMKNAEFINDFFHDWLQIKDRIREVMEILKKSWDKETNIKEDLSYFG